jgi:hypothetical protein
MFAPWQWLEPSINFHCYEGTRCIHWFYVCISRSHSRPFSVVMEIWVEM